MKKFKLIALCTALCLGLVGCGGGESQTSGEKEYIGDEEIAQMYSNPETFKGKYVKLTGKIFQEPEVDGADVYFQMWGDVKNSERNTIVEFKGGDASVKNGDYVIVDGKISGTFEGENAFGGKITAAMISAEFVEVSTYKDVVSPTISEKETPEATIDQHGMTISISKVEFAENETRIYVNAKNNTEENFSIYSYSIKAVQDGKQYEQESNYDADYDELQSDLLPGVESNGVVTFAAMDSSKPFQVYINGSSDNWDLDFKDYIFDIG